MPSGNGVTKKAGSLVNSEINKPVYATITGFALDFIFQILQDYEIVISPELETKAIVLIMALVTWLVPNRQKK